jgi:hypothetical protein
MFENPFPKHKNLDLGKTRITDKIRVSSSAIYRKEYFGDYWLVETWIFSDDPSQRSTQVIHGTPSEVGCGWPDYRSVTKARIVHAHIVRNLIEKYGEAPCGFQ